MNGQKRSSQQFFGDDQMTNVGARKGLTSIAITRLINGTSIARKGCVHQVESPKGFGRERGVVTRQAGGQDAIEDVYAAGNAVD